MSLTARFARQLPAAWAGPPMHVLGGRQTGARAADSYVLLAESSAPAGSLALHAAPDEQLYVYQQALVADDLIVIGFGHEVHLVSWPSGTSRSMRLGSYFVSLHRAFDAIYVASGEDLTRLDLRGRVVWTSPQLAIDGIRVELITDEYITGEAEHDPPGDWRPFRVRTADGTEA